MSDIYEPLDPFAAFLDWAGKEPERPYVSYVDSENKLRNVTLEETVQKVAQVSDILKQEQYSSCTNIGLLYGNEPGVCAAYLGCWAAGKTAVFLNPYWSPLVLKTITERLNISVVLHDAHEPPSHAVGLSFVKVPENAPSLVGDLHPCTMPEVAYISHSSGTTGIPKSCFTYARHLQLDVPRGRFPEGKTGAVLGPPTVSMNLMIISRSPYFRLSFRLPPVNPSATFGICPEDPKLGLLSAISVLQAADIVWGIPSNLVSAFQSVTGGTFPNLGHIILGGERITRSVLQAVHKSCPNADIFNWFGATEHCPPCIMSTVIPRSDMEKGLFPEEIALTKFWGIERVLLLDIDDLSREIPPAVGARGIMAILPKGPARQIVQGASQASLDKMYSAYQGRQLLLYSDVSSFVSVNPLAVVVHGRVGRDIKVLETVNGEICMMHINLDYYDNFIKDLGILPARTVTIYPENCLVSFLEHGGPATKEQLETWKQLVNRALKDKRVPGQIDTVVSIQNFPMLPGGKVDMVSLEQIAAKQTANGF